MGLWMAGTMSDLLLDRRAHVRHMCRQHKGGSIDGQQKDGSMGEQNTDKVIVSSTGMENVGGKHKIIPMVGQHKNQFVDGQNTHEQIILLRRTMTGLFYWWQHMNGPIGDGQDKD